MLRRGQSLSGCPLAVWNSTTSWVSSRGRLAELSNLPITRLHQNSTQALQRVMWLA